MSEDFWGDLPEPNPIEHPRTILAEQAAALAKRTNGLLHGDIDIDRGAYGGIGDVDTRLTFWIVCPVLQNYRFDVLNIYYRLIDVYPCVVTHPDGDAHAKCNDAQQFKDAVRSVLQSKRVRTAIAALLRDAQPQPVQ